VNPIRTLPALCLLMIFGAAPAGAVSPDAPPGLPNGIAAGDLTQDTAVLWARSSTPGVVRFELALLPWFLSPLWQEEVTVDDPAVPAKVRVEGLDPGQRYFYRVRSPQGGSLIGSFRTPASDGGAADLRFGVSGDWRGELAPYPAIANAIGRRLEFFVELGDTIYADYPSPAVPADQASTLAELRAKHGEVYAERFGVASWAALRRQVPVYAVIDDHEVTNDFAGGAPAATDTRFAETSGLINETALYGNGLQAFHEYNPIDEAVYPTVGDDRTDGRPDLYRFRSFGDLAALFLLDARSFRDTELAEVADPLSPLEVSNFVARSFDIDPATLADLPPRTMLGERQLDRLKADLLDAQSRGITWKFVMVPEPIQNLSVVLAPDRFEGYARERSEILRFIDEHGIANVVFVSADIHGTLINNLTYRRREDVAAALAAQGDALAAPVIPIPAFEITTGSVAFDAPFGPTVLSLLETVPGGDELLAQLLGVLGLASLDQFFDLPPLVKNLVTQLVANQLLADYGYDPLGLRAAPGVDARKLWGLYTAAFSYGWTEFSIDRRSRDLRVITYGIEPYTRLELEADPSAVTARSPRILSLFRVRPQ
jgi:phosphodiesterase/alkaline phosphatase D-like protein